MRKTVLLAAVLVAGLSFSTGLFAGGETKAKEKMIAGKIGKVECDKSRITITEVRELRPDKGKGTKPDLILKLTGGTKFTGVKGCKEITKGTLVYASYMVKEKDNTATQLILKTSLGKGMKRGAHGKSK